MKYSTGLLIELLACALFLSGCAVGMAASGKKNLDTSALSHGVERKYVILKMGPPETSIIDEDGNYIESYLIVKGNEPSPGRAVMHDALDTATYGLWEIIGTPIELIAGSESHSRATIYYDSEQKIKEIRFVEVEKVKDPTKSVDGNKTGGMITGI